MDIKDKKQISLLRAQELKKSIKDYLEAKGNIPKGFEISSKIAERREKVKKILSASDDEWNDWKWQMANRISNVDLLSRIIEIDDAQKKQIEEVGKSYAWAISPYYTTLMDEHDPLCPIRLIAIPSIEELENESGTMDPMSEEFTNPAGTVTRRYPDRLIINVTNECGSYCRFCQRRRHIGCSCETYDNKKIKESIDYIRENHEIRDVLVTGGDPLTLDDDELEKILSSLRAIPHVEIIRIGTRLPVTVPMRITKGLCNMLKKYHPIYINTHFNHPIEICEDSKKAAEMLADAGIPLGNQMVLLNGINNDKNIVKCLNQELLKIRIKPYYIFHPKSIKGTAHFKCSIDEGIEIMEHLRGYTSGLAIPYYIVNAPGGFGKVPILPQYLVSRGKRYFLIRTWEGRIIKCDDL